MCFIQRLIRPQVRTIEILPVGRKAKENFMTQKKPTYYTVLFPNVRYDERLLPTAKIIYSEILLLSRKNGYCHAKNTYFTRVFDISKRQIIRVLNALQECGYIKILGREERKRRIYVTDRCCADINGRLDELNKTEGDKIDEDYSDIIDEIWCHY